MKPPPPKRRAKDPKWKADHEEWREKRSHLNMEQMHLENLKQKAIELGLTERERDMLVLKAAEKGSLDGLFCIAIGDGIQRARFSRCHACVLPSKKYCYILNGANLYTNAGNENPAIPLALQGLGASELRMAGLDAEGVMTAKEAWDLAGNAFTSTVLAAILVGVVIADR